MPDTLRPANPTARAGLIEMMERYPDEASARKFFAAARWGPNGERRACPHRLHKEGINKRLGKYINWIFSIASFSIALSSA